MRLLIDPAGQLACGVDQGAAAAALFETATAHAASLWSAAVGP